MTEMENSQILEILRKSEEDSKWVSADFENLRNKYEGKVLAVKDKRVISYADTVEELVEKLEKTGENIGFLLIETVPRNLSFIL